MGANEIWAYDNSVYKLSDSTSLDPNIGKVNQELNGISIEITRESKEVPASLVLVNMVCALCNNSNVVTVEGKFKALGDSTEVFFLTKVALLICTQKISISREFFSNLGL